MIMYYIIRASISTPHIDELNMEKSLCLYISDSTFDTNFTYSVSDLYDNGFTGRVQNASRAVNYPCHALARDRRNKTAESLTVLKANDQEAPQHDVTTNIAKA